MAAKKTTKGAAASRGRKKDQAGPRGTLRGSAKPAVKAVKRTRRAGTASGGSGGGAAGTKRTAAKSPRSQRAPTKKSAARRVELRDRTAEPARKPARKAPPREDRPPAVLPIPQSTFFF